MNTAILFKVIIAIVETFAFFILGAVAAKRKMIDNDSVFGLSRFTINVLTPFLIFSSITANFTLEEMKEVWIYPLSTFGMVALHALLGFLLLPGLRHRENGRKETFLHMMAMNNYLFLPLMIISHLWGGKHVAALMLASVGSIAGQWTIGVAVMACGDWKKLLKNLLSPCLVAVVVSVLWIVTGCTMPESILLIIGKIGIFSVPMTLLLIGSSIYISGKKLRQYPLDLFYSCFARLVIIPLLSVAIVKLLPLPPMLSDILLVLSVMPGAVASVLVVREYGGCADFAGQLVLGSTCLGILTIPPLLGYIL